MNTRAGKDWPGRMVFLVIVALLSNAGRAQTPTSVRWSQWKNAATCTQTSTCTISSAESIVIDQDIVVGDLMVNGRLSVVENRAIRISARNIMVHGKLTIGSAARPINTKVTITLTGDPNVDAFGMGMGGRVFGTMGSGAIEMFGDIPQMAVRRLAASTTAGATSFVTQPVFPGSGERRAWLPGDDVIVSPTDFFTAATDESPWYRSPYRDRDDGLIGPNLVSETTLHKLAQSWFLNACPDTAGPSLVGSGRVCSRVVLKNETPVAQPRFGLAQKFTAPAVGTEPQKDFFVDERAQVANLSRNIVIQSIDDSAWLINGLGAHVMIMGDGASLQASGVEFRRMGQRARMGRYPVHFHVLSHNPDGSLRPNLPPNFVQHSSIWQSENRCLTIHGTHSVKVTNNICYDIRGHAIYLEDATEQFNLFQRNLVLKVRSLPATLAVPSDPNNSVLASEVIGRSGGASAFWITNPNNDFIENIAADAQGSGFWMAFPKASLWEGRNQDDYARHITYSPRRMRLGEFRNNVAHSNGRTGLFIDDPSRTGDDLDAGRTSTEASVAIAWPTQSIFYEPQVPWNFASRSEALNSASDTRRNTGNYHVSFSDNRWITRKVAAGEPADPLHYSLIEGFRSFKNRAGAVWNRAQQLRFNAAVVSSNANRAPDPSDESQRSGGVFSGSTINGVISNTVGVGVTANNATPIPDNRSPVFLASYHGTFAMRDNYAFNFPVKSLPPDRFGPPNVQIGGAFSTDDFYLNPVELALMGVSNLQIFGSNTPLSVRRDTRQNFNRFSGAIRLPAGVGSADGSRYWVKDEAFLTRGGDCVEPTSANLVAGKLCQGPYFGIYTFQARLPDSMPLPLTVPTAPSRLITDPMIPQRNTPMRVERLDGSGGAPERWEIEHGKTQGWMRHAALRNEGIYTLSFPAGLYAWDLPIDTHRQTGFPPVPTITDTTKEFVMSLSNISEDTIGPAGSGVVLGIAIASFEAARDVCVSPRKVLGQCHTRSDLGMKLREVASFSELKNSDGDVYFYGPYPGPPSVGGNYVWIKIGRAWVDRFPRGPKPRVDQPIMNQIDWISNNFGVSILRR